MTEPVLTSASVNSEASQRSTVTVVVPTFREVENIPQLAKRLGAVRSSSGLDLELFLMDDDSCDGTVELVESLQVDWVRLLCARPIGA